MLSVASHEHLVSIGMPVYNGEGYIRQALDSLLAQDYENFELIISDNGSTDGTAEICLEYLKLDKRIQYFRNERNMGALWNFNRVLEVSNGKYFAWAAHDDVWEPGFVSTLVRLLEVNCNAVLAFCAFDAIDEFGQSIVDYPHVSKLAIKDRTKRLHDFILQEERFGKPNLIYGMARSDTLKLIGGMKYWGSNTWGMDMLIVFKLLATGELTLSENRLFHKRVLPPVSHVAYRPRARFVVARFDLMKERIQERHGYFRGYDNILKTTGGLNPGESLYLTAVLWKKGFGYYFKTFAGVFFFPVLRGVLDKYLTSRIPGKSKVSQNL